jgi:hypothetical protein
MATCAQLLAEVERYRQNWLTKHAASCKNLPPGQHSADCTAAYTAYSRKLAEWHNQCRQAAAVTATEISAEMIRAFEEEQAGSKQ